jgi:hypothetical protein
VVRYQADNPCFQGHGQTDAGEEVTLGGKRRFEVFFRNLPATVVAVDPQVAIAGQVEVG